MPDVLTFDALAPERATVRIRGERYDLAAPDDVGLVGLARIMRAQKLMESLADDAGEDPAEMDKVHRALADALRIVLPGFDNGACQYVAGQCATPHPLNDWRVLDVMEAFNREAAAARQPRNRQQRRKASRSKKSTGAKSSPGSTASTASVTG